MPDNEIPLGNANSSSLPPQPPFGQADGAYVPAKLWEEQTAPESDAVLPVALGQGAPTAGTPVGTPAADEDAEAISAYKTLESRRRRKRRRRIIAGTIAGVLALGALVFWAVNSVAGQGDSETESYDIGVAVTDTFETSVSASGAVKPESQVVVTPEVEGIISEVRVAEGDMVSKGDVLFVLKNDTLDKAVQDAEQALKSANNGVTSAQNSLNSAYNALSQAESHYNTVFSSTYATQEEADAAGLEASEGLTAAQNAVSDAQLGVENAEIAVTTAQEALDQAKATAEKRTVTAPEGGAIVAMNAEVGASVGQTASTGSSSLVTIANLSTLRVSVQVNEVDINNLREGQTAEVTFSALPDVVLEAQVEHIAAIASGSGEEAYAGSIVTYDVDLVIPNPDPQVKPGMTARVRISTEKIENAMTVPAAALQMVGDTEAVVSVVTGYSGDVPEAEERTVTVVAQDSSTAVVEGPIADGDEVLLFFDAASAEDGWEISVG